MNRERAVVGSGSSAPLGATPFADGVNFSVFVSPEKFDNVTNGVTPRRWMVLSNPKLAALITSEIGERWVSDLGEELERIEPRDGATRGGTPHGHPSTRR